MHSTRNLKSLIALALSLQIGILAPQALAAAATGGSHISVSAAENPLSPEEWDAFQDFAKQKNIPMLDEEEFARFCREEPASCQLAVISNNNNDPFSRHVDATERGLFLSIFGALYTLLFVGLLMSFLRWRRDGGLYGWENSRSSGNFNANRSEYSEEYMSDDIKIQKRYSDRWQTLANHSISRSTGATAPIAHSGDLVIRVPRSSLSVNASGTYRGDKLGLPNELAKLIGRNEVTVVSGGESSSLTAEGGTTLDGYIDVGEDDALIIIPESSFRPEDIPIWTQAAKSAVAQQTGEALGGSVVVIPPSAN